MCWLWSPLEAGTRARWDADKKTVTCLSCSRTWAHRIRAGTRPRRLPPVDIEVLIEPGSAGASSHARYEYLHAKRETRIDAKFGRLAGIVKFITEDPQSIKAWKAGSKGERELAASLTASVGDRAVLLHDRKVPKTRGNIDHLVVASNGVWIIDAKNYRGVIQKRDVGGWSEGGSSAVRRWARPDQGHRRTFLAVGGREDRSRL